MVTVKCPFCQGINYFDDNGTVQDCSYCKRAISTDVSNTKENSYRSESEDFMYNRAEVNTALLFRARQYINSEEYSKAKNCISCVLDDSPYDSEAGALLKELNEISEVVLNKKYMGKVTRILNFGAFIEILPGKEGLLHISRMSNEPVARVEDVMNVGDKVEVIVSEVDSQNRINLIRA